MSAAKSAEPEDLTALPFEALLSRIEASVKALETGELSLEDSLVAYEKGVALVRNAQMRLQSMEAKVEELTADGARKPLDTPPANQP